MNEKLPLKRSMPQPALSRRLNGCTLDVPGANSNQPIDLLIGRGPVTLPYARVSRRSCSFDDIGARHADDREISGTIAAFAERK